MTSNTPDELCRKSIFFTPARWQDLQNVMQDLDAHTPSLAIAELISRHKKGSANDRPTQPRPSN